MIFGTRKKARRGASAPLRHLPPGNVAPRKPGAAWPPCRPPTARAEPAARRAPRPSARSWVPSWLSREHLLQTPQNVSHGVRCQPTEPPDEPLAVDRAQLIQRDEARSLLEPTG